MNFSEQLDQFVLRGAEKYCNVEFVQLNGSGEKCYSSSSLRSLEARPIKMPAYESGAASLKPIVLKLYETMLKIRDNDLSRIDCRAFAEMTLAEVSHMLEGGGG